MNENSNAIDIKQYHVHCNGEKVCASNGSHCFAGFSPIQYVVDERLSSPVNIRENWFG